MKKKKEMYLIADIMTHYILILGMQGMRWVHWQHIMNDMHHDNKTQMYTSWDVTHPPISYKYLCIL